MKIRIKPNTISTMLRYILWLGVLNTSNANRKYYGMPTTWVAHLTFNTFSLFLPEIYQLLARLGQPRGNARQQNELLKTVDRVIRDAVVDDPRYGIYVAPAAVAVIVAHPQFNIYKGELGKLNFLGFGLDAIPHSTTAFGFSNLIFSVLRALRCHTPRDAAWRDAAVWADAHADLVAGLLLVGASAIYETGEYLIHNEELRETSGDETKINMEWTAENTVFDLISNTFGWLAAVLLWRRHS